MSLKDNLKRLIFSLIFSFALVSVISGNVETASAKTHWNTKRTCKTKTMILKTKKAVSKKISKGLTGFDKKITLKVSKNLFKNNNDFWNTLHKNPQYDDLYKKINCSMIKYSFYGYDRIDLFVKYKTTKAKFKKFKSGIIRSENEFIDRMVKNVKKFKPTFSVNVSKKVADMHNNKASNELHNKLYNNVEFADIAAHGYTFSTISYGTYWTLTAKLEPEIAKADIKNLDEFVKSWVAENISPAMTEAEKVKKIFEFMTMEYEYSYGDNGEDWYYTGNNNRKARLGKYDVHSSFALVFKKGGVCSGYSRLFYRFAKEAGLDVIYTIGKTTDGSAAGHAWNMVKVDGNWYHIDVTWGRGKWADSSEAFIDWEYYLKGDDTMSDDEHRHSWDRSRYPVAKADYTELDTDGTGDENLPEEDDESDEAELSDEIPVPDRILQE